jgi:hypothetical protein
MRSDNALAWHISVTTGRAWRGRYLPKGCGRGKPRRYRAEASDAATAGTRFQGGGARRRRMGEARKCSVCYGYGTRRIGMAAER